jgi:hypothetical protein
MSEQSFPNPVARKRIIKRALATGILAIGIAIATVISQNPSTGAEESELVNPSEADREVIQAVVIHLLDEPEFDFHLGKPERKAIVLHRRTPEKTGILAPHQIETDTRQNERVTPDLVQALLDRNQRPGTYDCVEARYDELKFDSRIMVADLTNQRGRRPLQSFEKSFPDAIGWVEAYLPGYSVDGSKAIFRAWVGPSPHGGVVTAVLEKRDGIWKVAWYTRALFA